jgi:hypothetical protein
MRLLRSRAGQHGLIPAAICWANVELGIVVPRTQALNTIANEMFFHKVIICRRYPTESLERYL